MWEVEVRRVQTDGFQDVEATQSDVYRSLSLNVCIVHYVIISASFEAHQPCLYLRETF
jgi:hypothetical protein